MTRDYLWILTGDEGDDLRPWLSSMEYEFLRCDFTDIEKLNLVQARIAGDASVWFEANSSRFLTT